MCGIELNLTFYHKKGFDCLVAIVYNVNPVGGDWISKDCYITKLYLQRTGLGRKRKKKEKRMKRKRKGKRETEKEKGKEKGKERKRKRKRKGKR